MDSNTLATLNFMLGTLHDIKQPGVRSLNDYTVGELSTIEIKYLSFDAATTAGNNFEQVTSEPITGASREIARRMVIRYK